MKLDVEIVKKKEKRNHLHRKKDFLSWRALGQLRKMKRRVVEWRKNKKEVRL